MVHFRWNRMLFFILAVVFELSRAQDCPPLNEVDLGPVERFPDTCETGPTINPDDCFPGFRFGFANFIELDVSAGFSLGIRLDQRVIGWGAYPEGTDEIQSEYGFLGVSGGNTFACGIEAIDMQTICWGTGPAVSQNPCLPGFRMDSSDLFICALSFNPENIDVATLNLKSNRCSDVYTTANSLKPHCWGQDPETGAFQLPEIETVDFDPCVGPSLGLLDPLFGISVGRTFACLRSFFGTVGCSGEFAAGAPVSNYQQSKPFITITAGNTHFCGILMGTVANPEDAGKIECAGVGPDSLINNPPDVSLQATEGAIASGSAISCGIRADDEELICWGASEQFFVKPMPMGVQYTQIVGGTRSQHFCARRKEDNLIDCWGACEFEECNPPSELLAVRCSEVPLVGSGTCYTEEDGPDLGGNVPCVARRCMSGTKWEIDFDGPCACIGAEKSRTLYALTQQEQDYCTLDTVVILQPRSCDNDP